MKYCCNDLRYHLEHKCEVHDDVFDCLDHLFYYSRTFDEYGIIIHDGGSSYISIQYCPFCGTKFRPSKRDQYFDILETELKISSEDISEGRIPEEFKTDEWWKKRGL